MSVEEFEELARRAPETVTLEYINADRDTDSLTVHSEPDGDTHRLCRSHEYGDEVALPITFFVAPQWGARPPELA